MNEELKITKEDLVLWLDRPPSNTDLDFCDYLVKALENQQKFFEERNNYKELYEKEKGNWSKLKEWLEEKHTRNIEWYSDLTTHDKQYYMDKYAETKNALRGVQDKMEDLERL